MTGRRVVFLGGSRFVGPQAIRFLTAAGHTVTIAHRGLHEAPPGDGVTAECLHGTRDELLARGGLVEQACADVLVDTFAGGASAEKASALVRCAERSGAMRLVVVSSCDVYRHCVEAGLGDGSGRALLPETPLPLAEDRPLRSGPYPGASPGHDNVAMEQAIRAFDGSVVILRPGPIYGPRDWVCREWTFVRRFREGIHRLELPAAGVQVFHRGAVERVGRAVAAAVDVEGVDRHWPCNVVDPYDWTYAGLASVVGRLLGWTWEPVVVSFNEASHPWRLSSPVWVSEWRLRETLGVGADQPDPLSALEQSLQWYLTHGPDPESPYLNA